MAPIALDVPKCHTLPNQKPEVASRRYGRHFVIYIWRHHSVANLLFRIKFNRPVQDEVPMMAKRSKSKPGVEFNIWRLFVFGKRK